MPPPLRRTTFEMSRALEFFTERELQMQIGFAPHNWGIALTKELIDNAMDGCESAEGSPAITLTHEGRRLTVQDNGVGLPLTTLERSLDYLVRVSDKAHYVSPSRGQLGNALKCVWAAPYVLSREGKGCVTVATSSGQYLIEVELDHLAQQPTLSLTVQEEGKIKTGTAIVIDWPEKATVVCPSPQFLSSALPSLVPASGLCALQSPRELYLRGSGALGQ